MILIKKLSLSEYSKHKEKYKKYLCDLVYVSQTIFITTKAQGLIRLASYYLLTLNPNLTLDLLFEIKIMIKSKIKK